MNLIALCILLGFFVALEGITVKPSDVSLTTLNPMKIRNNTVVDEVLMKSSDNRIRRLIHPYMSFYYPNGDYNFPINYVPMLRPMAHQNRPQSQSIPSVALLYGGQSKYPTQRPSVQAGFIYKARPENYKTYAPNVKHHHSVHNQPPMQSSYNSYNYQPIQHSQRKSPKISFTPFLSSNQVPGEFVPIFNSNNLPYKSYDENSLSGHLNNPSHVHSEHKLEKMKPLDYDDEFIPMTNPSSPVNYQSIPSLPNHVYHSKIISTSKQKHLQPIIYSTPASVVIATTEAPNDLSHYQQSYPTALIPTTDTSVSYDYDEAIAHQHAIVTTSSPIEHSTIRLTTLLPDGKYFNQYHSKIKESPKYQGVDPIRDLGSSSLAEILANLQKSNQLPEHLTPDNIDNSIKTLVKILNNLKQTQTIQQKPEYNNHADDYEYVPNSNGDDDESDDTVKDGSPGPNSGRPGIDYPIFHEIPQTSFSCKEQRYKGFFGDPETNCQVWHYCDLNGGKASFLCPNGTIFSQVALTCDWWFNVKCSTTAQLYVLNERLYKFILPFTPKFPEDYSGPLVDKYLAIKFQEMEEKMRKEKKEKDEKPKSSDDLETTTPKDTNEAAEHASEDNYQPPSPQEGLESSTESINELSYTPGPIRVATTTDPSVIITKLIAVPSVLPPVPQTDVESERLEMVEIGNVGTSGHLSHSIN